MKTFKLKGLEYYATNCINELDAAFIFIKNKCGVTINDIEEFIGEIPEENTVKVFNVVESPENIEAKLDYYFKNQKKRSTAIDWWSNLDATQRFALRIKYLNSSKAHETNPDIELIWSNENNK